MGGNALSSPSIRLKKDFYEKVWKAIEGPLKEIFETVSLTKAYQDKESFGDMDILVSGPKSWSDFHLNDYSFFQNREIVKGKNSTTLSFGYDLPVGRFQVDLLLIDKEDIDSAHFFYDYNDLGGMMGVMAKSWGFKLTPKGLKYSLHHGSSVVDEILVTKDSKEILKFLGYNVEDYVNFKTLDNIFDFVVSNKYFQKDKYILSNRDGDSRRRDSKRSTYLALLEYLDKILVKEDGVESPDPVVGLKRAKKLFPKLKEDITLSSIKYLKERIVLSRISGEKVMKFTGLGPGIELGNFMKQLKNFVFSDISVYNNVAKNAHYSDNLILERFDAWKKNPSI